MSNSNKALQQIVSVDGWIGKFDEDGEASVHADVVFREGHFGSTAESTVRFKVYLERAEIVICVPDFGPLRIRRSSIRRTASSTGHERNTRIEKEVTGHLAADVNADFKSIPTGQISMGGSAKGRKIVSEDRIEHIADFIEQHFTTPDKHPGWEVENIDKKFLKGSPWNASDAPRLKVKRNSSAEQPYVRIEIRCRREDLRIEDLELKDPVKQSRFLNRPDPDKNRAAAEQVIKEELVKAGFLELPDMTEGFSNILIADIVITEDVS